jgi:hypothetical protein
VDEAARVLGLSVDAIRKRVQRGTIPYEKNPAGRVTILLDTVETVQDITGHGQDAERLVEDLRGQVAFLRRELEAERNAHAEARRITYILVQRVPSIASPETDAETSEGVDAPTGQVDREKPSSRPRSWWHRLFGLE